MSEGWAECKDPLCCPSVKSWHVGECPGGGPHKVSRLTACACGATFLGLYVPCKGDVVRMYGIRSEIIGVMFGASDRRWSIQVRTAEGRIATILSSDAYRRMALISRGAARDLPRWWPQEPLQPRPEPVMPLGVSCCRTHAAGYACPCPEPARLGPPKAGPIPGRDDRSPLTYV